jgi:hypothetical protein
MTAPTSALYPQALARIDAANAEDPNAELENGTSRPRELLYAERMSARLALLLPGASEALRLACRCQHLRRWEIPRASYPTDRKSYLQWRTALGKFHAETAGRILTDTGYDDAMVARVQALIRKERRTTDAETQALEDVAALVFLEHYFAPFADKHDDEKLAGIVKKTWQKMSPHGHEAAGALAATLPARLQKIVGAALAAPAQGS